MDPTLILGTVGVKQEYTLEGKTVYWSPGHHTHKHSHIYTNIYTHIYASGQFIIACSPTAMSLGGILHSDRKAQAYS